MRELKDIEYIMIHHSATKDDGYALNSESIRKYHMSFAYKGRIITEKEAKQLEKEGKRCKYPWRDIGYNFVVESVDNNIVVLVGRPLQWKAAGCRDADMNIKAIHICFVGDYNLSRPSSRILKIGIDRIIVPLMKLLDIDIDHIVAHRNYSRTSCPGKMFDMRFLKKLIRERI